MSSPGPDHHDRFREPEVVWQYADVLAGGVAGKAGLEGYRDALGCR